MAEVNLTVDVVWVKKDGDCSKCFACEDMIFGKMYNLSFEVANKMNETEIILCESCYNEINE